MTPTSSATFRGWLSGRDQARLANSAATHTTTRIRSFKGRGTSYWCYGGFQPSGPIVTASAGNFGQGLAYASRQLGHSFIVFVATNANRYKVEAMRRLGADVRLTGGDFDEAKWAARSFAQSHGYRFVEDGWEPALAEGAGTTNLSKPKPRQTVQGRGLSSRGLNADGIEPLHASKRRQAAPFPSERETTEPGLAVFQRPRWRSTTLVTFPEKDR
jgi:hypothetical protein